MRIIIKAILNFCIQIVYRPKIVGKKNIPENGAAIICPNHIHALDAAVVVLTAKRKINILAKEELYKYWILRYLAKTFGAHPVNRKTADISAVKVSMKILKDGEPLLIFPEGTRNGMEKGRKAKNGAVTLALKTGAPIVPIGIQGTCKPFTKVKLNIGKPIYYDKNNVDAKNKEEIDKLTEDLMQEIIALTKEKI